MRYKLDREIGTAKERHTRSDFDDTVYTDDSTIRSKFALNLCGSPARFRNLVHAGQSPEI